MRQKFTDARHQSSHFNIRKVNEGSNQEFLFCLKSHFKSSGAANYSAAASTQLFVQTCSVLGTVMLLKAVQVEYKGGAMQQTIKLEGIK